ncbi:MAG: hypothetical protein JSV52_07670 [Candidatus Zixiibacteriota bacterium]|nr:MAG: hypothetical protein JSV52_07670 [candidate division Zixibacteria bacterium]
MSSYAIGQYIGGLIITYLLTRLVRSIAKKRTNEKTASLVAFGVVLLIALAITSQTMGISQGIAVYLPCLILWLIVDMVRAKKEPPPSVRKDDVVEREHADVMR